MRFLIGTLPVAAAFAYVLFSPLVRDRRKARRLRRKGGER